MSSRVKSKVWMHFGKVNPTQAKCHICKNLISTHGASTPNMQRHLKNKHPTALLEDTQGGGAAAAATTAMVTRTGAAETSALSTSVASTSQDSGAGASAATATATTAAPQMVRRRQTQISMGVFMRRPIQPLQQSKVHEALVKMIAMDFHPFWLKWLKIRASVVEGIRYWNRPMSFLVELQFQSNCCPTCTRGSIRPQRSDPNCSCCLPHYWLMDFTHNYKLHVIHLSLHPWFQVGIKFIGLLCNEKATHRRTLHTNSAVLSKSGVSKIKLWLASQITQYISNIVKAVRELLK